MYPIKRGRPSVHRPPRNRHPTSIAQFHWQGGLLPEDALMTAAASKYKGGIPLAMRNDAGSAFGNSIASTLNEKAAPTPSEISENILRLRLANDCNPRTKNGRPAHRMTGVASANCTQPDIVCPSHCAGLSTGTISPIASTSTGRLSTRANQKRRVISFSSVLSPSSSVGDSGSSAIPHLGQDPGSSCLISGSIGQV